MKSITILDDELIRKIIVVNLKQFKGGHLNVNYNGSPTTI